MQVGRKPWNEGCGGCGERQESGRTRLASMYKQMDGNASRSRDEDKGNVGYCTIWADKREREFKTYLCR